MERALKLEIKSIGSLYNITSGNKIARDFDYDDRAKDEEDHWRIILFKWIFVLDIFDCLFLVSRQFLDYFTEYTVW